MARLCVAKDILASEWGWIHFHKRKKNREAQNLFGCAWHFSKGEGMRKVRGEGGEIAAANKAFQQTLPRRRYAVWAPTRSLTHTQKNTTPHTRISSHHLLLKWRHFDAQCAFHLMKLPNSSCNEPSTHDDELKLNPVLLKMSPSFSTGSMSSLHVSALLNLYHLYRESSDKDFIPR